MVSLLFAVGPVQLALITPVRADITLPSYAAGGDIKAKAESTGKKVTDTVALICAILGILGITASAGYYSVGRSEDGKKLLFGSITGLIILGFAYGIAVLVT
jgi:hypothetical protein